MANADDGHPKAGWYPLLFDACTALATQVGGERSAAGRRAHQHVVRDNLPVSRLSLACALRLLAPEAERSPGGLGLGSLGEARVVGAVTKTHVHQGQQLSGGLLCGRPV